MNLITNALSVIFQAISTFTGDYGIAIILITLLIKMVLFPFTFKQRKSMKRQQLLNEKMAELKKRYSKNEKKLNEEMALLMKREGTGLSGCLLAFIQLPLLFALHGVIRSSLTGSVSTFLLPWIPSLLVRDPYFILPFISVLIQLLPQTFPYIRWFKSLDLPKSDPKMALFAVAMSVFVSISLPSGVGLYYLVSGIIYALEQLVFNIIETIKGHQLKTISP